MTRKEIAGAVVAALLTTGLFTGLALVILYR